MDNGIDYYDICMECGSTNLIVEDNARDATMLTVKCRECGLEWDDYIEDIRQDYRSTDSAI